MQNKLPVSGQNSHLYVVVTAGKVIGLFVYADYEENTSFSKYTVYPLPSDFQLSDIDHIIKDIIIAWGGLFGLDLRSDETGIVNSIYFDSKPIGGSELIVDAQYYNDKFRSSILNSDSISYGDDERLSSAIKYMKSYNPSDLVWVVLNWDKMSVYSLSRVGESQSVDVDLREFNVQNDISSKEILEQLESVVGVHIERENIKNTLANILSKEITVSKSVEVWDILRSFITANLIKVKDSSLKSFGMKTDDAHLVITGDIASALSEETLFISVIDGLQLRGRYKVVMDIQQRSIVAQSAIGSSQFACPLNELYFNRFMYISSESENKAKVGDQAFTGKIETTDKDEQIQIREIMGQVGQFHTVKLENIGTVQIKPAKSVYFPNIPKKGEYLTTGFSKIDSRMVIDCRKIPVVYGPDENANPQRIRTWVNGLKFYD
jgi:hypothetical protein